MITSSRTRIIIGVIFSAATVGTYFHFPHSYAETQVPGIVVGVQGDPYYFSEGGFGIGILKYYGVPLTPYLTPQTTDNSSIDEILQSYEQASAKAGIKAIVDEQNRAKYYVVHFWSTSNGTQTFTTFPKFQPIITSNPITPAGTQQFTTGFSLESLAGKDKKWFYDTLIDNYIKPGVPQTFNADIDIVTGDGNILQTFQYTKCEVTGYVPFLSENLLRLQFTKEFKSEIRDRTDFTCDGFKASFDLRKPSSEWSTVKDTIDLVPDKKDTVQKYLVTVSSSIFKAGQTYQTFSKFTPMGVQDNVPLSIASNPISGKSKSFSLESLPSKDKQLFYQYVIKELSPVGTHELVDISVDLVTGNGNILQNWKYSKCDVTNYSTYRQEISAIWKFKQSSGPEIRDKTFFSCNGLQVNFMPSNSIRALNTTTGQTVPLDKDRAQVFTIHFSGGSVEQSFSYTFPKFAPYSKDYSLFNLPDYSFGDTPRFYVESLPSKDKGDIYKLISKYVNAGSAPQPFDASVDMTSGDGSVIQTWKYTKCDVTKYEPYFQGILIVNMFTEKFQPEIRDKIFFQCAGLSLEGNKDATDPNSTSLIQPTNFVPNDYDRAQLFVVKFSGGEIRTAHPFYTFGDFRPDLSASDVHTTTFPQIKSASFTLTSLPSKDKVDYYKFLSRYYNPTSKPEPFDASIELVTGDGSVLETWQYQKCQATDYETFLQSNLLYYTLSGKKGISETLDKTTFQCSGFSIKFDGGHEDLSQQQIIPSDENRSIAYVTHITSNLFTSLQTIGLVQEFDTLGSQQIQLESLPNKYNKDTAFYLFGKYINPGVVPELFDVTTEFVTGDGTKLYSIKYGKCYASDYSIFLNDNISDIKFGPPIKFEIRGKTVLQCSGVGATILPEAQPTDKISPLVQQAIGISTDKLACNDGFQLMIRPPHNNVACAKESSVPIFVQRGWQKTTSSNHNLTNNIKPIIPTVDERAVSYRVSFQGSNIPAQTLGTFSNFVPTSANSATNPSGAFSGISSFYLQSLPSKDKGALYNLVSQYINPGVKPEPTDVKVDVVSGDNSTLQTWNFGKCKVTNYNPYLDENVLLYKFHLKWQAEIKDQTTFSCSGLSLKS
ncbi:MAG TPA: hypothetical protein VLT10_00100 [Verrucomicrobiae bacterium]|nr:hypothetical protein [Verrucomicrobiae bacterium]